LYITNLGEQFNKDRMYRLYFKRQSATTIALLSTRRY
jgi:hypothetical protein